MKQRTLTLMSALAQFIVYLYIIGKELNAEIPTIITLIFITLGAISTGIFLFWRVFNEK